MTNAQTIPISLPVMAHDKEFEASVRVGDLVEYHEDGGVDVVRVISRAEVDGWLDMTLEVVACEQEGVFGATQQPGETFIISKNVKRAPSHSSLMWNLRPLDPERAAALAQKVS